MRVGSYERSFRVQSLLLGLSLTSCLDSKHPAKSIVSPVKQKARVEARSKTEDPEVSEFPMMGDPQSTPIDFVMRQAIRGRFGQKDVDFEAVLQKKGNELVVLGLTPWGSRAFMLRQTGRDEVEFTMYLQKELPFSPEYILQDIHRSLLWGGTSAWKWWEAPQGQGVIERKLSVDKGSVGERWENGLLIERIYSREGPGVSIRYSYDERQNDSFPPKHVSLENLDFGYQLELDTLSFERLETDATKAEGS